MFRVSLATVILLGGDSWPRDTEDKDVCAMVGELILSYPTG